MQANQKIKILLLSALLTAGAVQANEAALDFQTQCVHLVNWGIQKGADAWSIVWPMAQKYSKELVHQASQLATTGKQNVPKWTIAELHKSVDSPLLQETGNQFVDGTISSLPGAWNKEELIKNVSNLPTQCMHLANWSIQKGADVLISVRPIAQKYGKELAHQASQLAATGKQNASKWTIAELHKSVNSPLLPETGNHFVDGTISSLPGAWSKEELIKRLSQLPKKINAIIQSFAFKQQASFDHFKAIKYALVVSGILGTVGVIYCNKKIIAAKWAQLKEPSSDEDELQEPAFDETITSEK